MLLGIGRLPAELLWQNLRLSADKGFILDMLILGAIFAELHNMWPLMLHIVS